MRLVPLQSHATHTRVISAAMGHMAKLAAKSERGFRTIRGAEKNGKAMGEATVDLFAAIRAALDDGYLPEQIKSWFPATARSPVAGPALERMIDRAMVINLKG